MTNFTKQQLEIQLMSPFSGDLAAFALALLERAENAEAERDRLQKELGEAEEAIRYVAHGDGYDCYRSESSPEPRGVVGYTGVGGVWFAFPDEMQAAVRRARERGGRG